MTIGPWKPIYLHTYQTHVVDLDVRSEVSEALDVKLAADVTLSDKASGLASFVLRNPDGSIEASSTKISTNTGHFKVAFDWAPGKLSLWYPVGYGTQPLYTVEVELTDEVKIPPVICQDLSINISVEW
jgi:beta-mannosidase